jgi:uncharacterized surface protein with fasciclin (FAS1) repeats
LGESVSHQDDGNIIAMMEKETTGNAVVQEIDPNERSGSGMLDADSSPSASACGVPKSLPLNAAEGLRPGAFDVPRRAHGEIPSWGQREDYERDSHNELNREVSGNEDTFSQQLQDASISCADDAQYATDGFLHIETPRTTDDKLLIHGVSTIDPKRRRIYTLVGCLALLSVLTVVASFLVRSIISSASGSAVDDRSSNGTFRASPDEDATIAPISDSLFRGNMNWTIAFCFAASDGITVADSPGGQLFLETLNRTDTNFTFFGVTGKMNILEGTPISLITKMASPLWSGHTVSKVSMSSYAKRMDVHLTQAISWAPINLSTQLDVVESLTVQGQALDMEDMYDGMVLTSNAGYPLVVQLDPFRVNNFSISLTSCNMHFKNGVIHNYGEYPNPLAPWIGKSILDVLIETNTTRNGDISDFLALIEDSPNIKFELQLHQGNNKATTLFAPTNDALATMVPTFISDPSSLELFLLNHIVEGNFARSCWWAIPTGIKLSETELRLESRAGQVLDLTINDDAVTINGDAMIIQEDVFSEQGIVHIINMPLLFQLFSL